MPESIEDIETAIREATVPGFRDRLIARGEARGMIWRDGNLPENAPTFAPLLSYDLLSYGYALLGHGLRLLEAGGSRDLSQRAFENAAAAIEAVIARGAATSETSFHRVVAAAAFHLGSYSARAYSLLHNSAGAGANSVSEMTLVFLMLRDLDGLSLLIADRRADDQGSDDQLLRTLQIIFDTQDEVEGGVETEAPNVSDVVDLAMTDSFIGAISVALLAFERGDAELLVDAVERLQIGLNAAGELNMVPQWWCHRLAVHLLGGLWQTSFHAIVPTGPVNGGNDQDWLSLRATFIAVLFRRRRSEIELWPSQLTAAARILDTHENLVLSLPTSAGKTRIAELCILAALAEGKRVVFVTPLRALSAQTETNLERTFVPLGKTVTSLYGTIGVSAVDQDILRERDIVVATPEKLDFAIRNDPDLLDDVGLVVLDEGHMIGEEEREVRYEIQVQRLLARPDATTRRIICLSAVLPEGEEVQDFVDWLTFDRPGGLISSSWRPTNLRYGEIAWMGQHARLTVTVGDEEPFVPKFLSVSNPPHGKRKTPFPKNQQELTLATAWQLVEDGQTVLIFCPLKKSVNAFAKIVVDLHGRDLLADVFEGDPALLATALTIGEEWLGPNHAILACLRIGVAIHHGSLPTPYRKEVERLLQRGNLKITVSSPTLAQGLNLSASALLVHSIWRNKKVIKSSEFRNIVGRAGRAFVDSAGLVLHPMYSPTPQARQRWQNLVHDTALREMQSGLMELVMSLLGRMQTKHGIRDLDHFLDYLAGNTTWEFPLLPTEGDEAREDSRNIWRTMLSSLDCALLSLLSDPDVEEEGLEVALEHALRSSLWARSISHQSGQMQTLLSAGLTTRARILWTQSTAAQRRGYFLAGVGLETGRKLDEHADELNRCLYDADQSIIAGNDSDATAAIVRFAEIALTFYPFAPKHLPADWRDVLEGWLQGIPAIEIASGDPAETLEFIEGTLAYRLPWALEAVRVRAAAHDSADADLWALMRPDQGQAVAAVEAGTLNQSAALLMRAGFTSRAGAISAVESTDGNFTTLRELDLWLDSADVRARGAAENWPSRSTHDLWVAFATRSVGLDRTAWTLTEKTAKVTWSEDGYRPNPGAPYRIVSRPGEQTRVETPDAQLVGRLNDPINPNRLGLLRATGTSATDLIEISYRGPSDLWTAE